MLYTYCESQKQSAPTKKKNIPTRPTSRVHHRQLDFVEKTILVLAARSGATKSSLNSVDKVDTSVSSWYADIPSGPLLIEEIGLQRHPRCH